MRPFFGFLSLLIHLSIALLGALPSGPDLGITTIGDSIASKSEKHFDKAASYTAAKDEVALKKLIESKTVFRLKSGIKVEMLETRASTARIKIRPVGLALDLWTSQEAVTGAGHTLSTPPDPVARPDTAKSSTTASSAAHDKQFTR